MYNVWSLLGGGPQSYYYELTWTCSGVLENVAICGSIENEYGGTKSSSFLVKNLKWSSLFKTNSIYPSQNDLDFLICWRYSVLQSKTNPFSLSSQGTVASAAILNIQVINWEKQGATSLQTSQLRFGIVNYYQADNGSLNDYNYLPTILRIGGKLASEDAAFYEGVAVFFDGGISWGTHLFVEDCASTFQSEISCSGNKVQLSQWAASYTWTHKDYWPQLHSIVVSAQINSTSEFNFYVPIEYTNGFIKFFLAFVDSSSPLDLSKVFKLKGDDEANRAISHFPTLQKWHAAQSIIFANSEAKFDETDASCSIANARITTSEQPSPTLYLNQIDIYPYVSGCTADLISLNPENSYTAHAHFTIHSFYKLWEGSNFEWPYTESSTQKAQCTEMSIRSMNGALIQNSYAIICPYEGVGSTPITLSSPLKISSWNFPYNYGNSATMGVLLQFAWTGSAALLKAWKSDLANTGQSNSSCSVSSTGSLYGANTNYTKGAVTVNSATAIQFTEAFPKIRIQLEFTDGSSFFPSFTYCYSNIESITCKLSFVGNILTFELAKLSTLNSLELAARDIILNFWLNGNGNAQSTVFNGKILAKYHTNILSSTGTFITINSCNSAAVWSSGANNNHQIQLSNVDLVKVSSFKGKFQFSFTSNFNYIDRGSLRFDLSFWGIINQQDAASLSCFIYENGIISHSFAQFDYSQLDSVELVFKQKYSHRLSEIEPETYQFNCFSGLTINQGLSSISKLTATFKVDDQQLVTSESSDLSSQFSSIESKSLSSPLLSISLTKYINSVGFYSIYTFNLKSQEKTSIIFERNSRLIIEFQREISARLNHFGSILAFQDGQELLSEVVSDRRIQIILATELNPELIYGQNITIIGIDQPIQFEIDNQIYIALIPAGKKELQDLLFHTFIYDTQPENEKTLMIKVLNCQQTSFLVSQKYTLSFLLQMENIAIESQNILYVQFPSFHYDLMIEGWSPYDCELRNIETNSTKNLAVTCQQFNTLWIKITLEAQYEVDLDYKSIYNLTIKGVPGPATIPIERSMPVIQIVSQYNKLIYSSHLGNFNSSYQKFHAIDSNKQSMYWQNQMPVNVFLGYYKEDISLKISNAAKFTKSIDQFEIQSRNLSSLQFSPSVLSIEQGKSSLNFKLAAKNTSNSGVAQLKFSHEFPEFYQEVPPLNIHIKNETFLLDSFEKNFQIPNATQSLPIIIDFSEAIPTNELTIKARITSINEENEETESPYFSLLQNDLTFNLNESNSYQLIFIAEAKLPTEYNFTKNGTYKAQLNFETDEINAQYYYFKNSVTLEVYENDQTKNPNITLIHNEMGLPKQKSIQIMCSQPGIIYYVLSQSNKTVNGTETSAIKQVSLYSQIKSTTTPDFFTDNNRTIYGFEIVKIANSTIAFNFLNQIEAYAQYYSKFICVNQAQLESEPLYAEWKQRSNNDKPLNIEFEFLSTKLSYLSLPEIDRSVIYQYSKPINLTQKQRVSLACALSQLLELEKKKIMTINGDTCEQHSQISNLSRRLLNNDEFNPIEKEIFTVKNNLFLSEDEQNLKLQQKLIVLDIDFLNKYLFQESEYAGEFTGLIIKSFTSNLDYNYPGIPKITPILSFAEENKYINISLNVENNMNAFVLIGLSKFTKENTTIQFTQEQFLLPNFTKPEGIYLWWHKFVMNGSETKISFISLNESSNAVYSLYWLTSAVNPEQQNYISDVQSIENLIVYKEQIEEQNKKVATIILAQCFEIMSYFILLFLII